MTSLTWWTWVWVGSGSWWWTGRPGVLQSMGLQRVGHDWVTELTEGHSENWGSQEWRSGPQEPKWNLQMSLVISINPTDGHALCYRAARVSASGFGQAGDFTACELSLTDFSCHLRLQSGLFPHCEPSSLINIVIICSLCVFLHSFKKITRLHYESWLLRVVFFFFDAL